MLDKIYYINLEAVTHRNKTFLESMSDKMDLEGLILERFNAHDGRDYRTDKDLIMAAADEFPSCFGKADNLFRGWLLTQDDGDRIRQDDSDRKIYSRRGSLACCWSYLECLRLIVERNEVALILYDDRPLGRPVSDVIKILEILFAEVDPFHVLQLKWFSNLHDLEYSTNPRLVRDPQICLGLSGIGDSHNVYSPAGAQWFIDAFSLVPQMYEWLTEAWSAVILPGFYSLYSGQNGFAGYIDNDVQERVLIDALELE